MAAGAGIENKLGGLVRRAHCFQYAIELTIVLLVEPLAGWFSKTGELDRADPPKNLLRGKQRKLASPERQRKKVIVRFASPGLVILYREVVGSRQVANPDTPGNRALGASDEVVQEVASARHDANARPTASFQFGNAVSRVNRLLLDPAKLRIGRAKPSNLRGRNDDLSVLNQNRERRGIGECTVVRFERLDRDRTEQWRGTEDANCADRFGMSGQFDPIPGTRCRRPDENWHATSGELDCPLGEPLPFRDGHFVALARSPRRSEAVGT